eukprot:COSAG01_NODE_3312_length_6277_cov_34.667368_1_plen_825_part_00
MVDVIDAVANLRREVEAIGVPENLQASLDDVFARAEADARFRAESSMTHELNESASTLPLPAAAQRRLSSERATRRASRAAERAFKSATAAVPRESTTMDRAYLEGRYGIPQPQPQGRVRAVGRRQGGSITSAITARPNALLPMVNRHDPAAAPPTVYPADLEHGVANLQNRGFIPAAADVTPAFTHDPAPVTAGQSPLYPHDEQFTKGEIYSSPFGFNAVNVRLDLVAPVATTDPRRRATGYSRGATLGTTAGGETPEWVTEQQMLQGYQPSGSSGATILPGVDGTPAAQPVSNAPGELAGYLERTSLGVPADDSGEQHAIVGAGAVTGSAPQHNVVTSAGGAADRDHPHDERAAAAAATTSAASVGHGNHLVVRNGQLVKTPELKDFLRKNRGRAGVLKDLLVTMEHTLSRYAVSLAVVDGALLADLAKLGDGDLCKPTDEQLINTLVNRDQVLGMLSMPGQGYRGADGHDAAATAVQSAWRGTMARRDYQLHVTIENAAKRIAGRWRLHRQKRNTQTRISEIKEQREHDWTQRQAAFRESWHTTRAKPSVEVHIPSLSWSRGQRLSLSHLLARQNAQMARLCRLSDPLVDVVYVCPFPLSDDVAQYYHKLLGVGGVAEPGSRYRIVYPENYDRLPYGMSLASLLYYSPRCLKRIRNFCRGKEAYIVPSVVGPEDKQLAQILGLPLLAPEPSICTLLGSKAGSKQVFEDAGVNIPTSTLAGLSESEFYERLAELMANHLHIPRWIVKIGDEFAGRGHAHLDVSYLRSHRRLLKAGGVSPEEMPQAQHDMVADLKAVISKRVTIATKSIYRNWRCAAIVLCTR